MTGKVREYRARALRCEERAKKARNPRDREWQMVLAHVFRILAEAEIETAAQHLPRAA
jgi:hypothetical protein